MTLADVLSARRRLSGLVLRTPLVESPWLSDISGRAIHLKLESLQPTGSFKVRGALNATLALVAKSPDSPVLVTASAGNHGRALAYAARRVGLRAIVYTPRNAPKMKLEGIAQLGAELRAVADDYDAAERLAKEAARRGDGVFLSPYSHPDLIAATGTIGLEIVEDLPEIDAVVVPLGGGGLISGVALAIKSVSPRTEVIGVETEASHAFHASLAAGRIVEGDDRRRTGGQHRSGHDHVRLRPALCGPDGDRRRTGSREGHP
jgi:threonine dehydratase